MLANNCRKCYSFKRNIKKVDQYRLMNLMRSYPRPNQLSRFAYPIGFGNSRTKKNFVYNFSKGLRTHMVHGFHFFFSSGIIL